MRESDWSRANLLRSDWLPTSVAMCTTRILISKTAMVGCCKLSLYANGSCDEHAAYFRR